MCVSAQFLLHGSPPSPLLCLFIAQLSLLSLRCILGKEGGSTEKERKGGREGGREGMMDRRRQGVKLEEGSCGQSLVH